MLILLPLLLLFLSALVMVALSFQPKFGYHWPVAFNGAFLAWISMFILRINLPRMSTPITWQPDFLFDTSPTLLADEISWPFALAVATLTLAVILTDVVRLSDSGWSVWAGCLVLGGFGVMAVFSGNPLTLVMSWMFIDMVEMAILLTRVQGAKMRRNVVLYTTASMIGTMLVFFAQVLARAGGGTFTFENVPQNISLLLLVAVGLRLGVLPLNILYLPKDPLQRSLGTMLHLVPAAASLVLLVRISAVGIPAQFQFALLVLLLLAALYGAIAWARVRNELVGRPYWILAMTALAIAAAMRALPGATLAWSLALLYAGSLIFLASHRERYLAPVGVLGLLGISLLPVTPAYAAAGMYQAPLNLLYIGFILAHGLLLLGFVRHAMRIEKLSGVDRWVLVIYPVGLALLPLVHFVSGLWLSPSTGSLTAVQPWWPGLAAAIFAGGLAVLSLRGWTIPTSLFLALDRVFSLGWLYRLANRLIRAVGMLLYMPIVLLESRGGVLWTLLLLTLLLSLLSQLRGLGGG